MIGDDQTPAQGAGADGLKLTVALFNLRLPEHLDAKLILACHDELFVGCPEAQAKEVAAFVEEVMVAGIDEDLSLALNADHPDRVPVVVDAETHKSWGG